MKKNTFYIYITLLSYFFLNKTYSQNNLQFSQVISFNCFNNTNTASACPYTITVPANKVCKIEYLSPPCGLNEWQINGNKIIYHPQHGVLWLKAGDTLTYLPIYTPNMCDQVSVNLSILEFNIQ